MLVCLFVCLCVAVVADVVVAVVAGVAVGVVVAVAGGVRYWCCCFHYSRFVDFSCMYVLIHIRRVNSVILPINISKLESTRSQHRTVHDSVGHPPRATSPFDPCLASLNMQV